MGFGRLQLSLLLGFGTLLLAVWAATPGAAEFRLQQSDPRVMAKGPYSTQLVLRY